MLSIKKKTLLFSGMVYAVDVNSGRLRILKETAKLHQVDGVVTTVHADLRTLTVCYIIPYSMQY
jgi:tRNA G37 N-methylase Trm5